MSRLEVVLVNIAGEMPRYIELGLEERAIGDEFRLLIRKLTGPPGLDLLTERIEIALNSIDADRERVHDQKVLQVLGDNRRELTLER